MIDRNLREDGEKAAKEVKLLLLGEGLRAGLAEPAGGREAPALGSPEGGGPAGWKDPGGIWGRDGRGAGGPAGARKGWGLGL